MTELYGEGLVILLLLVLSAFFSGSETALTRASLARMHELSRRGSRGAGQVLALYERRERLIGTILFGNNLVNILAASIATVVLIEFFGDAAVAYATLIVTFLFLIFAEILPKTYALANADRMALVVAPLIRVFVVAFAPVTVAINAMVSLGFRMVGIETGARKGAEDAEEELRGVISLYRERDPELDDARRMLTSILDLVEVDVDAVMTHRGQVAMVDAALPPEEILRAAFESTYSRLPLYSGDPDNIVGVLHAKALLRAIGERKGDAAGIDVMEIAAEPWFVPETTTLSNQLRAFLRRREHFAVVVDEYGAFMGILTLEDILEEIVGEIVDEHDEEASGIRTNADGSCVVDGGVTIRDLNREMGWGLSDEAAVTVAGLVLYEAQIIPKAGQEFQFHGFRFKILRHQRNRITSLHVSPAPEETEAGSNSRPLTP